jgi:hypothetical protein
MSSDSAPVEMVDLEARLRNDATGAVRDEVCQLLESNLADVRRRMDAGLAPDEFAPASAVRTALETALSVTRLAWQANRK